MPDFLFTVRTPFDIEVRVTSGYWKYIVDKKHPVMAGKVDIVKEVLHDPDEIRQSKIDQEVFLYYKWVDRLYCAVVKHMQEEGFLITAYPTDKVKEGEIIWTR